MDKNIKQNAKSGLSYACHHASTELARWQQKRIDKKYPMINNCSGKGELEAGPGGQGLRLEACRSISQTALTRKP
jgi:hypothetical protein